MYKLFLVDDEIDLIEGIRSSIDWTFYDIEICGEADNGITALEKILLLNPDIIIMDIRMPKMNGLELLQNITSHKLKSKCIILSGYDDFSYAKKAIELNASNYLLKPCRPKDILESVLDIIKVIEKENIKEDLLKKYQIEFNENLPTIKENFLKTILKNPIGDSYDILNKFESFNINLRNSNLVVNIITLDYSTVLHELYSDVDIYNIKISIKNFIKLCMNELNFYEVLEDEDDIILVISLDKKEDFNSYLLEVLINIKNSIKLSLGFSVTIAVGSLVDSLTNINESYSSANIAIGSKFFLGDDRLITPDDINIIDYKPNSYPVNEELEIINSLRILDESSLKESIERFYTYLFSNGTPSKSHMKSATLSLLGSVYKFCIESDIDINSSSNRELSAFDKILQCSTLSEIKDQIRLILNSIFYKINDIEKHNSLVKIAVNYITQNYNKDISLESISKQIYITPGYLSQLFKQEIGINFLEFVNKYRIEKSKEFLKDKTLKNYEIATLVGYSNEKHFSKTFKKYTGLTPTKYKDSINS